MIKSYNYAENTIFRDSIQSLENQKKEVYLAERAVRKYFKQATEINICPGCGCKSNVFFNKWTVNYYRCPSCETIFVPVDDETIRKYHSDKELATFRSSEAIQHEAEIKRELLWKELIDWITYRCTRYLNRNKELSIISTKDRYDGFEKMLNSHPICRNLTFLSDIEYSFESDIALSFDVIQQMNNPLKHLQSINKALKHNGLLFLSARMGTGLDILVLKESARIYPFDYVTLFSPIGITNNLKQAGFEVLDYATPGCMDVAYVIENKENISENELFIKSFFKNADQQSYEEFQRFLQKCGMSSYVNIVAKKVSGV